MELARDIYTDTLIYMNVCSFLNYYLLKVVYGKHIHTFVAIITALQGNLNLVILQNGGFSYYTQNCKIHKMQWRWYNKINCYVRWETIKCMRLHILLNAVIKMKCSKTGQQ